MTDFKVIFQPTDQSSNPLPDIDQLAQDFQASEWSIHEAFMGLILAAAFADGDLADEERAEIATLVRRSRTLKGLTGQDLAQVNETVNQRLNERPTTALEEASQAIPQDMRLSVFLYCVEIVLADGKLLSSEAAFLNQITELMGLDSERAKDCMSVIMLKNRY